MNKKVNTIFFIIGATLFNVIVTILFFFLLLIFYSTVLYPALPETAGVWVMPVIFVISIVGSFFIYRLAVKILMKKVTMEKYFDPIFGKRQSPGKF